MSCRTALWKGRCYLSLRSEGRQWSDCQPSDLWAFHLRRRAGGEGSKGYGAERDAHEIAKTSRTVLARGIELGSGRARTATERRGSLTRPGDFVKWGRNERAAAFFLISAQVPGRPQEKQEDAGFSGAIGCAKTRNSR